jgi:hypothetical protein
MTDITKSILAINSNAQFSVDDEDINKITWLNGTTPISNDDILAKQTELKTAYDNEQWKRNRQAEYPSHEDCIHALLDGGDTLTNLQTVRQSIKTKYPKESE